MIGRSVAITGAGVAVPRMSLDNATLKAGSSVLTVCVREIATAAKDRLAAMCPNACMAAGPNRVLNSALVIGCGKGHQKVTLWKDQPGNPASVPGLLACFSAIHTWAAEQVVGVDPAETQGRWLEHVADRR